jgi:hypothetical protein
MAWAICQANPFLDRRCPELLQHPFLPKEFVEGGAVVWVSLLPDHLSISFFRLRARSSSSCSVFWLFLMKPFSATSAKYGQRAVCLAGLQRPFLTTAYCLLPIAWGRRPPGG